MLLLPGYTAAAPQDGKAAPAAPAKELLEYVREASRLGLKEGEIQDNAVKAGWPAAAVNQAIKDALHPAARVEPPTLPTPPKTTEPTAAAPSSAPPAPETPSAAPAPAAEPPAPAVALPDGYTIGAGDVLRIDVWDEPKASVGGAVVRPDGRIGMPLLKEVELLGLTPGQAEQLITSRLSTLIPGADVTVVVTAINSKKIYVIGGVKREGPIPYTYRMTVLQALSEAGGLSDYAKRKKIYILRTQNGKEYRLPFDYDAVLRGEKMELNIIMLPSDTLIVPR
ncbi:MAG: polysaccharide biosynthesis/export family protein [Bryobacteraceae bacterium]|nr:polysaccharide biosynthesis/export family protein [Bryobacteraceae bacterium]